MSDLICRNTMMRCQTPGMCSPHGGCRETEPVSSVWLEQLRSEFRAAVREREALKVENDRLKTLRSTAERDLAQELEVWRNGPSCWSCGDTGDVHDLTGEWRGECDCLAAQLIDANRENAKLKAECEGMREVMACVVSEVPRYKHRDGNAPGHCHTVPGIWDRNNGDKAGTECGWCKVWNAAVAMNEESKA